MACNVSSGTLNRSIPHHLISLSQTIRNHVFRTDYARHCLGVTEKSNDVKVWEADRRGRSIGRSNTGMKVIAELLVTPLRLLKTILLVTLDYFGAKRSASAYLPAVTRWAVLVTVMTDYLLSSDVQGVNTCSGRKSDIKS